MSLTTFLSPSSPSIILADPTAALAWWQHGVHSAAIHRPILGRVRVCCMAALRLRAPHRAANLVQLAPPSTCQYALQPRVYQTSPKTKRQLSHWLTVFLII
ncbi:hypothetical protein B0H14DRAFT_3466016 [Mycena olivaceomarginata]|nr:hypothetical protein B0H14DRAFT_3466016 [Mycena olivaceomarginata]